MINDLILIADSGSTKTDWCLIEKNGDTKTVQTIGINPYQMDYASIKDVLDKELYPFINPDAVKEIYFYGSGCSTVRKCQTLENVLHEFFGKANLIEVHHDMLGAARALCGKSAGIACILGTGSNSCYYDGNDIVENVESLGYFFGDEGSGAHLGKKLLTDYFHKKIPAEILDSFCERFNPSVESILDAVYNKPRPSRFLASFSPFLLENISHPYVKNLISSSFDEFFAKTVSQYSNFKQLKVSFIGSVAYYFNDILKESAAKAGITTDKFYRSAIEGLIDFHYNS